MPPPSGNRICWSQPSVSSSMPPATMTGTRYVPSSHPGQVGPVRTEQAARLLDDAGEDLAGVAERRDPGGDVA